MQKYASKNNIKTTSNYLSKEDELKLISLLKENGGEITTTKKLTSHSEETIKKYATKHGITLTDMRGRDPVAPPLSKENIEKILGAYKITKGNIREAERQLGFSKTTIVRYWKKNGLTIAAPGGKYSAYKIKKIQGLYEKCDGSIRKAHRLTGYARDAIKKYWLEAGYEIRKPIKKK